MDAGSSCIHLSQSKTLPLSKVVSLKYFELFQSLRLLLSVSLIL